MLERVTGLLDLMAASRGSPALRIGVIDGAIDASHPALLDARIEVLGGVPRCTNVESPSCMHGTFVAGVLVAAREATVPGICPACTIASQPIFCEADALSDCPLVGQRELARAIRGLLTAKVRIINMSIGLQAGGGGLERVLHAAYEQARRQGVLLVAAAGNQGAPVINPLFRHPWVIPVGALDEQGRALRGTSHGRELVRRGLLAPGAEVPGIAPAGGYTRASGTSMATAIVSGAAALLWSLHPDADAERIRSALLLKPPNLDLGASERWLSGPRKAKFVMNGEIQASPSPALDTPVQSATPAPAIAPAGCSSCAAEAAGSYAYAIGRLRVEFSDPSVRAEVDSRARELGVLNTPSAEFKVLSQRDAKHKELVNLYLARLARWTLVVEGVPTFVLLPRSRVELEELISALDPQGIDDRMVIALGPMGTTEEGNTAVFVDKVYQGTLQDQITRLAAVADAETVKLVFRVLGVETTPGDHDDQRAKNFLALRSREIYRKVTELGRASTPKRLTGCEVSPSSVAGGGRTILDVIFAFKDDDGEVARWRVSVDASGEFPFMTSRISQVYG